MLQALQSLLRDDIMNHVKNTGTKKIVMEDKAMSEILLSNEEIADILDLVKACYQLKEEEKDIEFTTDEMIEHLILGEGSEGSEHDEILEKLCHMVILKRRGMLTGTIKMDIEYEEGTNIFNSCCLENIQLTEKGRNFLESICRERESNKEQEEKKSGHLENLKAFIKAGGSLTCNVIGGVIANNLTK